MEEKQPKIGKYSLKFGLILGAISVIFGIMLFTMDAHYSQDPSNTIISIVILVAVIIWGVMSFRKDNGGFLSLGQASKIGTGIALVAGIIGIIYTMVLANVMDPEFATKIAEIQKVKQEAEGQFSPEQIQMNYDNTINYFWFSYPVILIFNIILGLVIGFVSGLIFKKAKPAY